MKRFALKLLCAAACLMEGGAAWAGPSFTVTNVSVTGDSVTITGPISPSATTAGPITLDTTIGTLVAWCVDIYHDVNVGSGQSLAYQIGTVTTNNAPSPTALTASQLQTIGKLAEYGQSLIATNQGTNDSLAAVQLAIWQTENAGFSYTGAAGASVSQALANAASYGSTVSGLIALNGTQTFVTADNRTFAATVPEPASMLVLGLGVPALLVMRRRGGSPQTA